MLLKKLLRTMGRYKVQFISMFLMVFLGVFVYAGINANWYGMQVESQIFFEQTNFADGWVVGENILKQDAEKLLNDDKIEQVERRLVLDSKFNGTNKTIELNCVESGKISQCYVTSGVPFDINSDKIWLSDRFAKTNNVEVGDIINLSALNQTITFVVGGLIKNPETVYYIKESTQFLPDYQEQGIAYISPKALGLGEFMIYNQMLVQTKGELTKKEFADVISKNFENKPFMAIVRDEQVSYNMFKDEIEANKAISGIFPLVFMLIAVLTMIATMSRITQNEKVQIGTLKALGFKNSKITWHYTSYALIIGILGCVLGGIVGTLVFGNIFLNFQSSMYDLPKFAVHIPPESYIAVFAMISLLVVCNYLACLKLLRGTAKECLRPVAPKKPKKVPFENTKFWRKLSFNTKWNLRDIFRNKVRAFIAIVGVAGCMMLSICAFSFNDSINYLSTKMYDDLHIYQNKLNLKENVPQNDLDNLVSAVSGEKMSFNKIEIITQDSIVAKNLEIYDVDRLVKFENAKGKRIKLENDGIYVSRNIAKEMNLKIGDIVKWRVFGTAIYYQTKIIDTLTTPLNQTFAMSYDFAGRINLQFKTTAVLTNENISVSNFSCIKNVQSKSNLIESIDNLLHSSQMIIMFMIVGAVILGVVVLYNLGVLAFTERYKEMSTLKVVGFGANKLNKLLITQNLWLTIIGVVLGVPFGFLMMNSMAIIMPASMDITFIMLPLSVIICVLFTVFVSVCVALMLCRKNKQIDMVSSLKGIE